VPIEEEEEIIAKILGHSGSSDERVNTASIN
jgi:hypothetical protein